MNIYRDYVDIYCTMQERMEEQRVMIITSPLQEYERKLGNKIWDTETEGFKVSNYKHIIGMKQICKTPTL